MGPIHVLDCSLPAGFSVASGCPLTSIRIGWLGGEGVSQPTLSDQQLLRKPATTSFLNAPEGKGGAATGAQKAAGCSSLSEFPRQAEIDRGWAKKNADRLPAAPLESISSTTPIPEGGGCHRPSERPRSRPSRVSLYHSPWDR